MSLDFGMMVSTLEFCWDMIYLVYGKFFSYIAFCIFTFVTCRCNFLLNRKIQKEIYAF